MSHDTFFMSQYSPRHEEVDRFVNISLSDSEEEEEKQQNNELISESLPSDRKVKTSSSSLNLHYCHLLSSVPNLKPKRSGS